MQIEELKKNMSLLEHVLAKTDTDIKINVKASETAQKKILKRYRHGFISCAVLAVVFIISCFGKSVFQSFQPYQRGFLAIYLTMGALWYMFLYIALKRINVSQLKPSSLFIKTTRLKIYTFSGEALSVIGLAVFFTLFLSDLITVSPLAFWLCVITLAVGFIRSVVYFLPKYIELYNRLNTVAE